MHKVYNYEEENQLSMEDENKYADMQWLNFIELYSATISDKRMYKRKIVHTLKIKFFAIYQYYCIYGYYTQLFVYKSCH